MTTLRKLQLVILSIAKDIDELCKRNNIEYHLIAGSAIGAVRHKGFIPWDDDLDIEMTDDNYRRFLQVCHTQLDKDKYYVQEGVKDWPQNFTKIKLLGTKITEKD
jgi:lipopolysaccharide cholinephosphotransferase